MIAHILLWLLILAIAMGLFAALYAAISWGVAKAEAYLGRDLELWEAILIGAAAATSPTIVFLIFLFLPERNNADHS